MRVWGMRDQVWAWVNVIFDLTEEDMNGPVMFMTLFLCMSCSVHLVNGSSKWQYFTADMCTRTRSAVRGCNTAACGTRHYNFQMLKTGSHLCLTQICHLLLCFILMWCLQMREHLQGILFASLGWNMHVTFVFLSLLFMIQETENQDGLQVEFYTKERNCLQGFHKGSIHMRINHSTIIQIYIGHMIPGQNMIQAVILTAIHLLDNILFYFFF